MSPTEPRFVRVVSIIERNFGELIEVNAEALTEDGSHVPIGFTYDAHADRIHIARADAYDALFARVYARASHADVEAAKRASKEAALCEPAPLPPVTVVDRGLVTDPDRIERLAAARIGGLHDAVKDGVIYSCGVCLDGSAPCPVEGETEWTCLACGRFVGPTDQIVIDNKHDLDFPA